jgi:hypothetical protein
MKCGNSLRHVAFLFVGRLLKGCTSLRSEDIENRIIWIQRDRFHSLRIEKTKRTKDLMGVVSSMAVVFVMNVFVGHAGYPSRISQTIVLTLGMMQNAPSLFTEILFEKVK